MKLCIERRSVFDAEYWHCPTCGFTPEMACCKRQYYGDELAVKVRAADFDVVFGTCFMGTLFLPQYVSRRWLVNPVGGEGFEAERTLPRPINGLLEVILSFELLLIKAGLRFLFGGMRVVAARKS